MVPKYSENGVEQNLVMFDSIDQLEGKTIHVMFKILSARGLPVKYSSEIMCKYKWIDEKSEEYQTEVNTSKSINPEFNYTKDHELFVSPFVVSHIWEGAVAVGVISIHITRSKVYGKMSQENINAIMKTAKVYEKSATGSNAGAAKSDRAGSAPGSASNVVSPAHPSLFAVGTSGNGGTPSNADSSMAEPSSLPEYKQRLAE